MNTEDRIQKISKMLKTAQSIDGEKAQSARTTAEEDRAVPPELAADWYILKKYTPDNIVDAARRNPKDVFVQSIRGYGTDERALIASLFMSLIYHIKLDPSLIPNEQQFGTNVNSTGLMTGIHYSYSSLVGILKAELSGGDLETALKIYKYIDLAGLAF